MALTTLLSASFLSEQHLRVVANPYGRQIPLDDATFSELLAALDRLGGEDSDEIPHEASFEAH